MATGGAGVSVLRYVLVTARTGGNDLSDDLKKEESLFIPCPSCEDEFRASKAILFDATKRLPPEALAILEAQRADRAAEKARSRMKASTAEAGPMEEPTQSNKGE